MRAALIGFGKNTMTNNSYPRDLARHIRRFLPTDRKSLLTLDLLTEFFETAYFASMRTEEGRGITCTLAFVDYNRPDTDPPPSIRPQRASFVRFGKELTYSVSILAKLAQAADPEATSIAVAPNADGVLVIIGLIDQEVQHRSYTQHEQEGYFARLGIFQVEVLGIGILSVYNGTTMIAGLRQNGLVSRFTDALHEGPVHTILRPHIESLIQRVRYQVGPDYDRECWWSFDDWDSMIQELWIGSLSRVLLTVQRYSHGGAILLLNRYSLRGLRVKHKTIYKKLNDILVQDAVNEIRQRIAWWDVHDDHTNPGDPPIPQHLYFTERIAIGDREDAVKAATGAIRFMASLSRIDGLVLMDQGLRVRGFGVEITTKQEPPSVFIAKDPRARVAELQQLEFDRLGTRHRINDALLLLATRKSRARRVAGW